MATRVPGSIAAMTTSAACAATLLLAACASDPHEPEATIHEIVREDVFPEDAPRGDWRELRVSLDRDAQYTMSGSGVTGGMVCAGSAWEFRNRWSSNPHALLTLELTFGRELTAAELADAYFEAAIDGTVYPIPFHDLMRQDPDEAKRWINAEQLRIGSETRIRLAANVPCVRVRATDKIVHWPPTTYDDLLRARTGARSAMQEAPADLPPALDPAVREARIVDVANRIAALEGWAWDGAMSDDHWAAYIDLARRLQLEDDRFVAEALESYLDATDWYYSSIDPESKPFLLLRVMFAIPPGPHPSYRAYKGWLTRQVPHHRSFAWPVSFEDCRFALTDRRPGSRGARYAAAKEFTFLRERFPYRNLNLNLIDPAQDPLARTNAQ